MNVDLGQLTTLTLISDGSTPGPVTGFGGLRLTIPGSVQLPRPGEYSTLTASGVTVNGYTRVNANGDLEWLMTPANDPSQAKVDNLVTGGWTSQTARAGYLSQANYLLGQGITGTVLWPGLKNFYDWAQADLVAKGWHP